MNAEVSGEAGCSGLGQRGRCQQLSAVRPIKMNQKRHIDAIPALVELEKSSPEFSKSSSRPTSPAGRYTAPHDVLAVFSGQGNVFRGQLCVMAAF